MTLRRPLTRPTRRPQTRFALEPRIVFDGAVAAAAETTAEHHDAAPPPPVPHAPAIERNTHPQGDAVRIEADGAQPAERNPQQGTRAIGQRDPGDRIVENVEPADPHQIAFVDASVADIEAYLPGFKGQVITLKADQDGIAQIAQALAGRTDLTAIHILSHGEAGLLLLGNSSLDTAGITGVHAADIATIKDALTPGGDLLLYGCDVAAGAVGQEFIQALANATRADVAASTDDTGAADRGGNWTLEAHVGTIDTKAIDASGWEGVLAQTSTDVWTVNGTGNGTTATSTVNGITTTVSFGSFSKATATVAAFVTTGAGGTLNNIPVFTPAVENTPDLGFTFNWDTAITGGGNAEVGTNGGTGVITITFSSAVTNPIIHLDRIGGQANGAQNGMRFTLVNTGGLTLTSLSGTPHFAVDTVNGTIQNSQIDQATGTGYSSESSQTANLGTAAGSVRVNGTMTSVSFTMSAAPNGNQGTGGDAVELKVTFDPTPIAVNDTFTSSHDQAITLNVKANDSDPQGDAINVTKVNGTAITAGGASVAVSNGTVALNAGGNLVFTPTAGYVGTTSFTYSIADPAGGEATATVNGTIVEAAPVANNDTFTTNEDTTITFDPRVNDTDSDGDALTIKQVNGTAITVGGNGIDVTGGVVTINAAGNLIFTPTANYNGPTSFTYQVSDTLGMTSTATINGTVVAVDDAPVVNNNNNANLLIDGDFEANQQLLPNTNNIKGSTYGAFTSNVSINVLRVDGSAYTPGPDRADSGNQYIDLTADGTLSQNFTLTAAQTISFGAAFSNRDLSLGTYVAPTTQVDILNSSNVVVASANALSLTRANGAESWFSTTGSATLAAGTYTYRVTLGNFGHVDSVFVRTSPNYTTTYTENSAAVSIATSGNAVTDIDSTNITSATIVLANPITGDYLTLIGTLPAGITASGYNTTTHTITLSGSATKASYATAIANIGFASTSDDPTNANRTVNVTVSDGTLSSNTAVTTIVVIPVNDAPVAVNDSFTIAEDSGPFTINVRANDSDPDDATSTLIVTQVNGTAIAVGGTVAVTGGTVMRDASNNLIFTPNADYNGTTSFTYTIADPSGATSTATVNGTITAVNDAPTSVAPATATTAEDTTFAFSGANKLTVADVDSPNLTVTLAVNNGTLTLGTTTGLTFTTGTGAANATMTFSGTQAQLNTALATLTFAPTADYNGSSTLNFTTSDGSLSTVKSTAITITPVADIVADSVTTLEDTAITFNAITGTNGASADNFENANRVVTSVTQGANGTVTFAADGTLTYTPNANYNGTDTFTYTVTSGGVTETATETVTITAVNDAPTSTAPATISGTEDTTLAFTGANTLTVFDVDSPSLTVTLSVNNGTLTLGTTTGLTFTTGTGTANTTMTFSGTQAQLNTALATLTFAPTADYNGSATLNFNTNDGSLSTAKTTAITITPVADIVADSVTTLEDTAITFNAITGTNGASADNFENANRVVTSVTQGANGTVTFAADGTLTYTPNANYNGTDTFTYTVTSGGVTETATETVTITAVNDAPTSASPATVSTAEDTNFAFSGANKLTVADVDSPNLTVTLAVNNGTLTLGTTTGLTFTTGTGTANATMTFSGTQAQLNTALASLTFAPTADYNGSSTLNFTTSDGSLSTVKSTAITITPVADIVADSVTTLEDTAITFNAITGTNGASADNFENANRVVTSVTQGANGTVTFAADGTLTYTPNANYNGTDTFTYTVTSGGVTETATETVTITAVNDAPTSVAPATVSTAEDTNFAFSGANKLTVADVDSPNLTVTLAVNNGTLTLGTTTGLTFTTGTGAANATMTFSGTQAQLNNALATLTFAPTADYNGSSTLNFTTSDGSLSTVKSTAITITPVADIVADSVTTLEDTAITFNAITGTNGASADNFENANRVVTSVTQGANGTVTFAADGTLTYTPNANYNGTDTFTYTVTSGGVTETATETVTITAVNDAPTNSAPASINATEDTTLAFTGANALAVFDVDSPNLSVTLTVNNGTLTLGTVAGLTFTTGTGTANTTMTFSGTQAQLNTALATLTFAPTADYNGSATLNFSTSDGSLSTARNTSIVIAPVADIVADSVTTNEDTPITFNAITGTNGASADNFENSNRVVTSVTQGAHGTVTFAADGTLTYTPNADYNGTDTFTYTVTSGGVTETATETVTITPVNDAPTSASPAAVTTAEDTTVSFTGANKLSVADIDSPNLTVTLSVNNGTLTLGTTTGLTFTTGTGTANTTMTFSGTQAQLNNALGSLTFAPTADYNGSSTLNFTTSDGSLSTVKSTAITITPVADIVADSVTTNEDTAITFNAITGTNGASADNFENSNRVVTSVTQGTNGTVTFAADGTLTYTPNADFNGTDTFTYTVTSGGVTETATETVTITAVNDAPTSAAPATVTTVEDTTFAFTGANKLSVADIDSPNLSVTLSVNNGTLTLGTTTGLTFTTGNGTANTTMTFSGTQAQLNAALASLTFVPTPDYYGSATLNFNTNDGSLAAVKTVAITVTPVADIVADSVTTLEDTAITFNAITGTNGASADNFENANRAVTSVTQGAHGSVTFLADGTLTYTPNADYNGSDTFTYTVTSGGATETATETVTITPVNDAPTSAAPASVSTAEDTTFVFTGANKLTVADVDSPNLTVTLSVNNGTLTLGTTTGLTFTLGNGTANTTMTFSGTQAQLNTALATLTFAPTADYNGSATLNFNTNDGSLSTAKTTAITITPVADIVADSVTTLEDTAITFNAITGTNGASADNFENANRVVTSVTQGANGTVTFAADGTLTYTPNANYNGTDTFTYTVTSGGVTETATETVTITAVNDAPTSTAPATATTSEDTNFAFSGANKLTVADVDSPNLTVTLAVNNGTLTLGTTTGLTFTTGTGAANATMTFSGTQAQLNTALATLTFAPTADYNGSSTLNFTTSDGSLSTVKSTAITITPVADIVADSVTTLEDTAITFNAITGTNGASADNFENSNRVVTSVTQGANGTVTFAADGTLTYTPNANYNGTDTFTYTVTSGGVTETATETVTITAVNDAPTSTAPASVTLAEDNVIGFVGANSLTVFDVDNPNLTVTLSVNNGTLTLGTTTGLTFTTGNGTANTAMTFSGTQTQLNNALASLTFAPTADYNGAATLNFNTSDGSLSTAKTTAITITPVADIVADSVTTLEDTAITFNAITGTNGASADNFENANRVVTSVTQGANGTVTFAADGTLTYTPNANYNGTDTFTYTVTSGGVTETATETVTITAVNDAPTSVAPATVSTVEDTNFAFSGANKLTVADVDSPNLTVTLAVNNGTLTLGTTTGLTFTTGTGAANATMTFSGTQAQLNNALATLTFAPTADYNGSSTLNFTTSDGSLSTVKSTAITITPVADIVADSVTTLEDTAITFNAITGTNGASADNFENANRVVTSVTQGANGTVTFAADGTLTYTPNANYNGTDTFTYTVTSGGVTETATETVTITAVNDAPTSTSPANVSAPEDTAIAFSGANSLTVADVDSPNLSVTLTVTNGTLTLGTTTGLTFTTGTGAANTTMTFSGTQAQLNTALASLTFAPTADYNGTASLAFMTSDGSLSTTRNTAITITPVADIVADSVTTLEDTPITFNAITGTNGASADNFENANRVVTSVTQGAHGTVTFQANGNLTYSPNANYNGTDSFTYTVTSGGVTETATVTLTITAVNDPPVANNDTFSTNEDTPISFDPKTNDTDIEGDALHITAVAGTAITAGGAGVAVTGGVVTLDNTGKLTFTPTLNFNGSTSFTYTIADTSGATSTATINGTIVPVNDPPVAVADAATVNEDSNVSANVLANDTDVDGDTLSVSMVNGNSGNLNVAVAGTTGGLFTIHADGSFTFATNGEYEDLAAGQTRVSSVSYTASDGHGGTSTATLTVTVTGVNDAPIVVADSYDTTDTSGTPTGQPLAGNVLTNDRDPEHAALVVSAVNGSGANVASPLTGTYGTLTLNANGSFSYNVDRTNVSVLALNKGQSLVETFNYTASDGQGGTATTTLTIRIDGTNDAPNAGNDFNSITEGQTVASGNVITGSRTTGDGTTTVVPSSQDTDPLLLPLTVSQFRLPSESTGSTVTTTTNGTRTGIYGTLTIQSNGTYTYALANGSAAVSTLAAGQIATDTFVYTVTDGVQSTEATITITVSGANNPPVAVNDTFVTNEDTQVRIDVRANDSDPDGDPITVTLVNGQAVTAGGPGVSVTNGSVRLTNLGALAFTPTANFNGTTSFTYTISDPSGATSTATVTGTVVAVNDPPTAVNDTFTVNEDTTATITVLANDSDVDGDAIHITAVNGTAISAGGAAVAVNNGSVTLDNTGKLLFTPNANYNGSTSFTYTIADPSGATSTATVNGTIVAVNDPPTAVNDTFVTNEDNVATIAVLANDSDVDGDAIHVTAVNGTAISAGGAAVAVTGGSVTLDASGNLIFTPTANYNGSTSFTYTIADPSGATSTATVNGTINPVNDPPVAVNDSFTVNEDNAATIAVLTNDTDVDGDALHVTAVNGSSITIGGPGIAVTGGVVTLDATNRLIFTPTANYNGSTSFTYTIADPSGATSTATVNGTINPVNDPPVAVNDSFTVNEDNPATIAVLANDSDVDGDAIHVTAVNGTAISAGGAAVAVTGGSVTLDASGNLIFTPTANYNGSTSFTYTIADPSGATSTATVNGTINPVNDPPVAVNDSFTVNEDNAATIAVLTNDSDVDGDALHVTAVNGSSITIGGPGIAVTGGVVTLDATNRLIFTPTANYNGSTSFTYTIADPSGATSTATVNGTINPVNDPPVAVNDSFTVNEDNPATIAVLANDSDVDGDAIHVTAVNGTAITAGGAAVAVTGGSVTLDASGNLIFAPTANYNGSTSFTYTIADPSGATSTATVNGTINPVNDPPVAVNDNYTIPEDSVGTFNVLANDFDPDGDPISLISVNGNALTINGPGVAVTGGVVTLDGSHNLVFTPTANYNGPISFTYTVSDPSGATGSAMVSGNVTPVNDPPVANNDSFTILEDNVATIDVRANDTDVDGDPLHVTQVNGQAIAMGGPSIAVTGGSVALDATGRLVFTPTANYNGATSFVYTVADPSGATSTATVNGTITPVNDPPVANNDTFTVAEDNSATLNVRTNDTDAENDPLTVVQINGQTISIGGPGVVVTGGVVTLDSAGNVVYTPNANYNGSPSFTYTIADPSGATSTATVSGTVTPVNDIPVANDDNVTVDEDHSLSGNVVANDTDADGDTLTIVKVANATTNVGQPVMGTNGGIFTVNANGTFTFSTNGQFDDLGAGQTRISSATYTVSDGNGGTAVATINVTVTGVNDPPVATADTYETVDTAATPGGTSLLGNVTLNDTDAERAVLSVSQVDGTSANVGATVVGLYGSVRITADGGLTYAVDRTNAAVLALTRGQVLTDTFTYQVSDGAGGTSTTTVTVHVNGTNDSPDAGNDANAIAAGQASSSGNVISGVRTTGDGTTTTVPTSRDTDANGDPLSITLIRLPADATGAPVTSTTAGTRVGQYGTLTIDSAGNYTYALNNANPAIQGLAQGQQVVDTFVYTVTDGMTPVEATITIVIGGSNDNPIAVADTNTAVANGGTSGNVLVNDSDPDQGQTLSVAAVGGSAANVGASVAGSAGGLFTINGDGTYTFNANGEFTSVPDGQTRATAITYTVSDGNGGFATTTVTVTVRGLNDPPTAVNDTFTSVEDTPVTINVRANDSDPDGDPLTVVQVNGAPITAGGAAVVVPNGSVVLDASGNLVFTPNANYSGGVTFSYTIADPSGTTATAFVSGTVTPVNDPPVANNDSFTVNEDNAITVNVRANDTDSDNDPLTVTKINGTSIVVGGPGVAVQGGVVTLNSAGDLVFTPNANYNGPATFTYTVADPSNASSTATVSGTVVSVNDAPVAVADTAQTTVNTPVVIDVLANDSDVDGALVPSSVQLVGTTNPGDPLVIGGQGTYTINPTTGAITFTPVAGFIGTASPVSYTITDSSGLQSSPASVSVSVVAVNHAPVANPDTFTTDQDTALAINVRANDTDADGDPLTITQINGQAVTVNGPAVVTAAGSFSLDATGNVRFVPTANYTGPVSFSYTVRDPSGATSTATASGTVVAVNHAPVANPDTFTTNQDTALAINVRANDTDADGDPLTITQINGQAVTVNGPAVVTAAGSFSLDAAGNIRFVPTANYTGPVSFSYTVRDPSGATSTATASGTVVAVNHAPVANPDSFTVAEDSPATINVRANDTDADGDALTIKQVNGSPIAVGGPGVAVPGGIVTLDAAGRLVFTPAANYNGAVSFTYTVADPSGATATATVSGTVTPVNDAPVAVGDQTIGQYGSPVLISVLANDIDVDGDQLTVSAVDGHPITANGPAVAVTGGTVTLDANGNLLFVPTAGSLVNRTSFTYTVTDPSGTSSTATVVVGFDGVTNPPLSNPYGYGAYLETSPVDFLPYTSPALFVLQSVSDTRSEFAVHDPFSSLAINTASAAEIVLGLHDDLSFAAGDPVGRVGLIGRSTDLIREGVNAHSESLYVQHAVRYEALPDDQALFVQHAVRQSQLEAQLLQLRASSPDGATLGTTTLLDPFALGTAGSLVPVRDVTPPAKDAAHHHRHHAHRHAVHRDTVSVHDLPADATKAHSQSGFSAQVRHSARGLHAHHATPHRHAATVVPRNGAAPDDHRK